ncbi:hypothetical protein [Bradyrhizobium nanningense]|uniref:hypothetical protein n=1 Tax=Bradyrhizobium nanningense TaxID=1325118 RepID=UPI001008F95F|nr:hypothetical protein [Bradyrhizobium nanningense]
MDYNRTAVIWFGVAVAIVITLAYITTLNSTHIRTVQNTPAGTVGLARPHPPIDRAPGQELPARQ